MATDIRIDCNHLLRIAGDLKTSIGSSFGSTVYEVRIDLPIIPTLSPDYYDNRYYTKSQTYTKTEVNSLFNSHATDIIPWSQIDPNSLPDSLAGYGITDSYTIQQANLAFIQNQSSAQQANSKVWISGTLSLGAITPDSNFQLQVHGKTKVDNVITGINAVGASDLTTLSQVQGLISSGTSGFTPTTRLLTINGVAHDLSADRSWTISTDWSAITSKPTTLSGYGITDSVPSSRTLTINGTTYDLTTDRSWTVGAGSGTVTSVTSSNSDISIINTTTTPVLTIDNINGITKSYYDPTSSIQTQFNSKANLIGGNIFKGAQFFNPNSGTYPYSYLDSNGLVAYNSATSFINISASSNVISYNMSSYQGLLYWDNLTTSRNVRLPDGSGTLALVTDIPPAQQVFQQHTAPTGTLHDGDLWYVTP